MKEDKNFLSKLSKYIMLALMAVDIVILCLMPFKLSGWLTMLFKTPITRESLIFYYIVLYLGGITGLLMLNNMRRLFNLMLSGNPFSFKTPRYLSATAYESFFISVIMVVKIFYINTFMTMLAALIFAVAGLFCTVLSQLFKAAAYYKEDSELTV